MLTGQDLHKKYEKRPVVRGVTIECKRGEVVGLLGPNGAGKTTTFYMIVGEITPDSGKVFLDGVEITKLPMYARVRLGLGYLPQETSIFRNLSVIDNILVALEQRDDLSKQDRLEEAEKLVEEFGLQKVKYSAAYTLSGGEKRRTEVARACALNPKFFLLDEPFAGIDPLAIQDIQLVIKHLKDKGLGILVTDHNVRETLKICDRGYVLVDGQIIAHGSSQELISNENAIKYYFGKSFISN